VSSGVNREDAPMAQETETGGGPAAGASPAAPGALSRGVSVLVKVAVFDAALAIFMWPMFSRSWEDLTTRGGWGPLAVLAPAHALLIGYVGYEFLRGRNCKLTLTADGLTVGDWRGRETSLLWADVTRIREGRNGGTWLLVADRQGDQPPVRLAHGDASGVEEARDSVLSHLDSEEVQPDTGFWVTRKWRWWERK